MKKKPENDKRRYSALCSKVKNRHLSLILMYCEAAGSYTWIYLISGEKIKVSCRIGVVVEKLCSGTFIRCHKSFIVNIKFIKDFSDKKPYTLKLSNGFVIPIAGNKRTDLIKQILKFI
jgi:two-component system, LytTR family, response regulator